MSSVPLPKALECPTCFALPSLPVYQCPNGHIFCSICLKKSTVCGICREPLQGKPIQSLIAEVEVLLAKTIARLEISVGENKSTSLINYCSLLGLTDVLGCKERIPRNRIVSHMTEHQLSGVNGNRADVIQELEDFTNQQSWFPVLYFQAYDEIFFLLSSMQEDLNLNSSLVVAWKCVIVGDTSAAKNFCLQLSLTNSEKGFKNLSCCPVIGIENHENSVNSQFSVPLSQLKEFGKYSGGIKVEWTINVLIVNKSENKNELVDNTAIPKVKTRALALKEIVKPSSSLIRILGNSESGNAKVFLDLAYENELIGRLVIELRYDVVPLTAENFRCLCTGEKGFGYKGTCFYFIDMRNCICGGDVTKDDGTGEKSIYGDTFKHENFFLKHNGRGILSMGNSGNETNGSNFFITLREQSSCDGFHVVFGKVVEGMKVLDDLEKKLIGPSNIGYDGYKKMIIQNCGQ